ncbi:MAG: DNA polymerase III subunit delta [Candidatus Kapaibacterium sp.]
MFNSVEEFLKNDNKFPVIFLFGEDEFSREEAQNKILARYIKSEDDKFNFDLLDGDDTSHSRLIDLCMSYPMMSEYRVVLVKRFEKMFSGKTSKKMESSSPIAKYLKNPSETTILILCAQTEGVKDVYKSYKMGKELFAKKSASLKFPFNILVSNHVWIEFPRVYESDFPKWCDRRIRALGKSIKPDALEVLVSRTKHTLRDLGNEIDKLMLATDGKKEINLDDVNSLTGSTREFTVFELQKAIADRNLSRSVMILNKILSVDRQEMLMLAIFSKFFMNLMKVCDGFKSGLSAQALAQKVGLTQFQFNDYLTALRRYQPSEIENALMSLCRTDLKLKSSNSDSLLIMQSMIFDIIEKNDENTSLR